MGKTGKTKNTKGRENANPMGTLWSSPEAHHSSGPLQQQQQQHHLYYQQQHSHYQQASPHSGQQQQFQPSCYEWNAELVRDRYVITITVSEFKGKVYIHVKKIYKNGKTNYLALELKDFYDLFDNRTYFAQKIEECVNEIKRCYGDVAMDDTPSRQFDSIPKSERTKELEASQMQAREENDLREEAIRRVMKEISAEKQQPQQQQQQPEVLQGSTE
jgi:hypothetical protein